MTVSMQRRESGGLFWGEAATPVPLEGVKVHAEMMGHASRVTMSQRFRNGERTPIEAVYVFPLPEAAAVCGLAMRVGDRTIEAAVEERDKAFEQYDDAMAAGHGAALLDQERPNVFTISVGNVLPGQEVAIELRWVAELPMEGEAIRFMLPTAVAPRYAPDADRHGVSPTPAERVSPPLALDVPYGLALDVDVLLPCPVRAIDSPSHPVRFELDGSRARVTLSHGIAAMDRDFVLLVTPQEAAGPRVLVERSDDGLVTAAVSFTPRLPAASERNEVVFLVDRSGSMAGSSIEQVRAALHLCLRGLSDGDLFNIVGFGSTFSALFRHSQAYGQETLEKASAHVDALDADLGGTEILPALRSVAEGRVPAGVRRQVVILTDGQVSNEAAVIELAEAHAADTRIFTFGIGYGASEHLVRSLARVTMGEAEFIQPGERIEPKVLRQFGRLGAPAVREVKVAWEGAEPKLRAPCRPPAIFNGEAGVMYARFEGGSPAAVTLSGRVEGEPVRWTVPVDASGAAPGSLLATLAARAAIRDLEEGTSALHETLRGSAQRGRREDRIDREMVALAKAYHLASSRTSFVAIETREAAPDLPAAELRRVPVALTHGWGGVERAYAPPAAALSAAPCCLARLQAPPPSSWDRRHDEICSLGSSAWSVPEAPEATSTPLAERPHVLVARLQRADGSWRLDARLASILGVDIHELRGLATSMDASRESESIVATLAALRFLEAHAADARDEWRLLAQKAERQLATVLASRPAGTRQRLEAALFSLLPA